MTPFFSLNFGKNAAASSERVATYLNEINKVLLKNSGKKVSLSLSWKKVIVRIYFELRTRALEMILLEGINMKNLFSFSLEIFEYYSIFQFTAGPV